MAIVVCGEIFGNDRLAPVLKKNVIFDLDGTLLDTSPGILESVLYSARRFGYPELSPGLLAGIIGPPLRESLIRCFGCGEKELEELVAVYRHYYSEKALFHAIPYEGVLDLCRCLSQTGDTILTVATNKPQALSERILKHFGFDQYISFIHGADLQGKLTKADLIRKCIYDSASDFQVMVGDTGHDAKGAMEAGVPFLAVTYGFGNQAEMLKYPHIGVAASPAEILQFVL